MVQVLALNSWDRRSWRELFGCFLCNSSTVCYRLSCNVGVEFHPFARFLVSGRVEQRSNWNVIKSAWIRRSGNGNGFFVITPCVSRLHFVLLWLHFPTSCSIGPFVCFCWLVRVAFGIGLTFVTRWILGYLSCVFSLLSRPRLWFCCTLTLVHTHW